MPEEWRRSVLIPIYKNKGNAQCCGMYRGIKLMSHTMKIWKRIIEARLKGYHGDQQTAIWIYARKEDHRCHVCFKNINRKVQERSKKVTLCIRRPREGLRQGSAGRAVVLYEKIRNSGKVCATCTGYV